MQKIRVIILLTVFTLIPFFPARADIIYYFCASSDHSTISPGCFNLTSDTYEAAEASAALNCNKVGATPTIISDDYGDEAPQICERIRQGLVNESYVEDEKLTNTAAGVSQLLDTAARELNPANLQSVPQAVGRYISFFVGVTGTATLIFYIYAGFLWMTAAGNADRVDKAKSIMMWTTFGVIAIFGSYILVDFVFGIL